MGWTRIIGAKYVVPLSPIILWMESVSWQCHSQTLFEVATIHMFHSLENLDEGKIKALPADPILGIATAPKHEGPAIPTVKEACNLRRG